MSAMASHSRASTPRSSSSDSSDAAMLDAPTHAALQPARPRQPSATAMTPPAATCTPFSLLLSLPRELRDRIYAFALASPRPFWHPAPAHPAGPHAVAAPLLRTSRQLHAEAGPVLYAANRFLFTHPSDCNLFRVVASPHARAITSVYFRIRERDLRLWTSYLGSKSADRSLAADVPRLKSLCVLMRCGGGVPRLWQHVHLHPNFNQQHLHHALQHNPHLQLPLGQHQPLPQQQQHPPPPPALVPTGANPGQHLPHAAPQHHIPPPPLHNIPPPHHVPPPPPPPPAVPFAAFAAAVPHHHPQPPASTHGPPHTLLTLFLRYERELGLESLCLSLRDTLHDAHNPHQDTQPHTHPGQAGHRQRRADARNETSHPDARDAERDRNRRQPPHTDDLSSSSSDSPDPHTHKTPPDVKIICLMRVPKPDLARLLRLYPDELALDRNGDARTAFRRLHGAEVCLEVCGVD